MNDKLFRLFTAVLILLQAFTAQGQLRFHSHNDYTHARPFWDAYRLRANSIEADVFPVDGKLMVAHASLAIRPSRNLETMYLQPVIGLFKAHQNKWPSADSSYTFYLMIDIKEKWDRVLPLLIKHLEQHPACFNRQHNPKAVQVFISGDRPPDTTFHRYPPEIMFDGLPGVHYRQADLDKIVMISTDFHRYSSWNGKGTIPKADAARLREVIDQAHAENKPVRFWGAPDSPDCWRALAGLGADVINTDQLEACKEVLLAAPKTP